MSEPLHHDTAWMKCLAPLALLAAVTAGGGCAVLNPQGAPADKVAQAEATFTSVVTALTDLRGQGHVNDPTWARVKEIAEAVDASFEAIHAELDAGKPLDVSAALKGVRASMERLTAYKTEAERARTRHSAARAAYPGSGRNAGQGQVFRRAA